MKGNIIGRINSVLDQLPNSEYKVGVTIITNPKAILDMTVKDLALNSNSSSASVIRLCKSIDIESFTKLKLMLAQEITYDLPKSYADINENESISEIKSKLLGNAISAVTETIEQLNDNRVEDVVELLYSRDIIIVYGIGASYLVAENMMQKFSRIGKNIICVSDQHLILSILANNGSNALLFVISNSGETNEILKIVEVAKDNDICTVGLCQFGNNSLSSKVDVFLNTVKSNESNFRSAATSSLHAQFIVIDLIFSIYFTKNFSENRQSIYNSRKLVDKYKRRA